MQIEDGVKMDENMQNFCTWAWMGYWKIGQKQKQSNFPDFHKTLQQAITSFRNEKQEGTAENSNASHAASEVQVSGGDEVSMKNADTLCESRELCNPSLEGFGNVVTESALSCTHNVAIKGDRRGQKCTECYDRVCPVCWLVPDNLLPKFFGELTMCPNCCQDYDAKHRTAVKNFATHIKQFIEIDAVYDRPFLGLCNLFCQLLVDGPLQGYFELPTIFEKELLEILRLWIFGGKSGRKPMGPPPVNPWSALLLPQVPVEWHLLLAKADCESRQQKIPVVPQRQIKKSEINKILVVVGIVFEMHDGHPTMHLATELVKNMSEVTSVEFHMVDVTPHPFVGEQGGPCDLLRENLGDRYHSHRKESNNKTKRKIVAEVRKLIKDLKAGILVAIGFFQYDGEILRDILQKGPKPAPIVVQFLGHAGTTGFADYLIVDNVTATDSNRKLFSEKLLKLDCFQCNSMKLLYPGIPKIINEDIKAAKRAYGLPTDGILFGNMSSYDRFDVAFLTSCFRILCRVPMSFLVLLKAEQSAMNRIKNSAAQAGCRDRIIFVDRIPDNNSAFFQRALLVDVFLDSRVYTGHTVSVKLLWNRCILLTIPGESFASRVTASLLTTYGALHCIFKDASSLENYAAELATEPEKLQEQKLLFQTLRDTSKLFDTPNFANGFLNVLKQAWKQWEISQNYIDITARDIETSTAMIEALTANTPAPTAVIENRIEAPTAAPTEAAIEDWTGVIEDPTAAPTEAEIDDSTGLIEDPTEPCIIDDTITHAILQFGLVQNFATARIFLTDLTKKFSDFRVAYKGSSFLVLYAADKSTNVVLKICLSGDRAQKEGDIFAQKKEDQSNLFANAIWYDFENDNFIGPISVFAVEKMNYHILDLFSDLAKKQAENDQSDV